MPSFESLLLTAPSGFAQRCVKSNAFVSTDANSFRTLAASCSGTSPPSSSSSSSSPQPQLAVFSETRDCLVYIFESYRRSNDKPVATLASTILNQNTVLSTETVDIIVEYLTQVSENSTKASHSIGQMVDFNWRLGVAVSSNSCTDLQNPYIAVTFAVEESDGTKNYHSAELTLDQFKEFDRNFREAALVVDGI